MTPYLAILKDSFREAFASRVLWILLGVVTLMLIVLAGFGMEEHAGASFASDDLLDAAALRVPEHLDDPAARLLLVLHDRGDRHLRRARGQPDERAHAQFVYVHHQAASGFRVASVAETLSPIQTGGGMLRSRMSDSS